MHLGGHEWFERLGVARHQGILPRQLHPGGLQPRADFGKDRLVVFDLEVRLVLLQRRLQFRYRLESLGFGRRAVDKRDPAHRRRFLVLGHGDPEGPDREYLRCARPRLEHVALPGSKALYISGHSTRSVGYDMSVGSAENEFAVKLFRHLPRRYDLLAEVLSFGQNARWRGELVKNVAGAEPRRVLDVATGTAGVAVAIARSTSAHVTGVDVSDEMLEIGRGRVAAAGLESHIELQSARAESLPFADGAFDAISFTYVLRYVSDPPATLGELARALRPGGVMAGLDFYVPPSLFAHAAWWLYTRAVLPVAGFVLGGMWGGSSAPTSRTTTAAGRSSVCSTGGMPRGWRASNTAR